MEGSFGASAVCPPHQAELASFSRAFLDPPQEALLRRSEGELHLQRILRAIDGCPRCAPHLRDREPKGIVLSSAAGSDPWSDPRVRVVCTRGPGGGWVCSYHAELKRKLLLLGDASARKTDLVRPSVYDGVPDTYREQLGAKVMTRHETAEVSDSGADVHLVFTVWDIAGRRFYNKRQLRAYCRGAKTILAACDLSETRSVEELGYWLSVATRILGKVTVVILARDRPAADPLPIAEARLAETARTFGAIVLHVPRGDRRRMEHLFHGLGAETVRDVFGLPWRPGMFA